VSLLNFTIEFRKTKNWQQFGELESVYTKDKWHHFRKRKFMGNGNWYIVECRRINGKPRPFVLEYLRTPETLLKRLRGEGKKRVKSFSHGHVLALLKVAREIKLPDI